MTRAAFAAGKQQLPQQILRPSTYICIASCCHGSFCSIFADAAIIDFFRRCVADAKVDFAEVIYCHLPGQVCDMCVAAAVNGTVYLAAGKYPLHWQILQLIPTVCSRCEDIHFAAITQHCNDSFAAGTQQLPRLIFMQSLSQHPLKPIQQKHTIDNAVTVDFSADTQ